MKLLSIVTILLLLRSWSSFSQNAIRGDTMVKMPIWRALRATQDLIRYDELVIRAELLQEKVSAFEKVVTEKDSLIESKKATITRQEKMLNNQSQISTELQLKLFRSQKEVRKQKVIKWVVIGLAAVSGVFALK